MKACIIISRLTFSEVDFTKLVCIIIGKPKVHASKVIRALIDKRSISKKYKIINLWHGTFHYALLILCAQNFGYYVVACA